MVIMKSYTQQVVHYRLFLKAGLRLEILKIVRIKEIVSSVIIH